MPGGGRIALEVGLAEARNALIVARRIEHAQVELERFSEPLPKGGVIGEVIIGERVDKRSKARSFNGGRDPRPGAFEEMHLKLRDRMRPNAAVHHSADEEDFRLPR